MSSRLICIAVLTFTVFSACEPDSDPTKPGEKRVIPAAELLADTSNVSSHVEHSAAVDFSWDKMAHIEWTTGRQGMVYVITNIVVRFPRNSAPGEYDVKLLRVHRPPESRFTTSRTMVSLQLKRTLRWGEKGAMVTLHTDGHAVVGMYRRWPWSNW